MSDETPRNEADPIVPVTPRLHTKFGQSFDRTETLIDSDRSNLIGQANQLVGHMVYKQVMPILSGTPGAALDLFDSEMKAYQSALGYLQRQFDLGHRDPETFCSRSLESTSVEYPKEESNPPTPEKTHEKTAPRKLSVKELAEQILKILGEDDLNGYRSDIERNFINTFLELPEDRAHLLRNLGIILNDQADPNDERWKKVRAIFNEQASL